MAQTKILPENKAKDMLREYGIETTEYRIIEDERDLSSLDLVFPVVLKVCSSRILHKSDVGGVRLNIADRDELREEFLTMQQRFPGELFLVERMERDGLECIIGLINDEVFGLAIMFGLGGIFAEVFQDVTFRIVPINVADAESMMDSLKTEKILEGYRGIAVSKEAIKDTLLKVSEMSQDLEQDLDQLDLNPVIVRENSLVVVDAKLILKG